MDRKIALLGVLLVVFQVITIIFVCYNVSFTIHNAKNEKKHRVLLVILDSFRHDYLEIGQRLNLKLKNLNRIASSGARSLKVTPVYPSVTMPNHQTLVTGLYSPYHGITYNTFNDSSMGYEQFSMDNQSSINEACWYDGYPDPIWVTCEKNPFCRSGSMLWPNTDAVVNGYRPYRYVGQFTPLNQEPNIIYPYDRRVDMMIGWMKNDLIDFGMIYFDEPDVTSHRYGPLHKKTLSKLAEMDVFVGRLLDGLEKSGLLKTTDLLLTGDHGMTQMSLERVIEIDNFVPPEIYKSTYSYPVGIIYPNPGKFDEVLEKYKAASSHIKVYKREDLPSNLFYTDNANRISPIVTVVDLGWFVNCSHYKKIFLPGYHGFSPYEDDMKTTLLALGPSFKKINLTASRHVDLYSLMMHLLGLRANPHNGSFEEISKILKDEALPWKAIEDQWQFNAVVIAVVAMVVAQLLMSVVYLAVKVRKGSGTQRSQGSYSFSGRSKV